MKTIIIFFCLFGSVYNLFSQRIEHGVVRFAVEQENGYFEILINDTLLVKSYRDTLPVGKYSAKAWSPGYEQKAFDFYVQPNDNPIVFIQLNRSDAYRENISAQVFYERKKKFQSKVPLTLMWLSAVYTSASYPMMRRHLNELNESIPQYDLINNTSVLNEYKLDLFKEERRYNYWRSSFYVGLAATGSFLITSIITRSHLKRNYKRPPQFHDPSPFVDKFGMNINPTGVKLTLRL